MDFAYYLHSIYILASSPPWLELLPQCLFMQNLLTSPAIHPPSSWGAELGIRVGLYTPLYLNFLSLPILSLSPIPLPSRLPSPAAANKHGGRDRGAAAHSADPGLSEAGGGQGHSLSQCQGGRGAFWGHLGLERRPLPAKATVGPIPRVSVGLPQGGRGGSGSPLPIWKPQFL